VTTSLAARIPADPSPENLLEAFVEWTLDLGIEMYPAQEEAVLELLDGRHVVLNTPTGSGKSLVAVAAHFRALALGQRSFYTSPIKALVSEKFFALCETFGAENVGMMTGDASVNPGAPIIACTAEILSSMALRQGVDAPVDVAIMDEFHYYSDRDRGMAWQIPLLVLERVTFLLMSATLGDTKPILRQLEDLTGREGVVVRSDQRPVPLHFSWADDTLLETVQQLVERDRAPVYIVNFSQREATELAQSLTSHNLTTSDERREVSDALGDFRFDSPFGRHVRRYVRAGIGVHHAGLLPKYRLLVERLAQQGLLKVICGTDTLGVGVNVPIRTVLFTRLYKFDGEKSAHVTVRDFKQIAGRAGRRGFDDVGYVVAQAPAHVIENRKLEAKVAAGKLSKKKLRKNSPPRGYVAYDEATFERMQTADPERLTSVFDVDHGMLLSLMMRDPEDVGTDGGYGAMLELIDASHASDADKDALRARAAELLQSLIDAGLVVEDEPGAGLDTRLELTEELQDDFSVFHSLGLFLLDALGDVDLEAPDHAERILTLVESIQENPRPVLMAQQHRARGEKIAELKEEGMDYHDRMEALEDVTWPKPDAEVIYAAFNAWSEHHPWLDAAFIRPKSIAREMFERWMTFTEYVNELGLERVEGVLLRYLSQTYKTLVRTVPETYRTEAVIDMISYLRAMLALVDSSLVREWEAMLSPGDDDGDGLPEPGRPVDISRDRRSFHARIRAEMHHLVRALATEDHDGFVAALRVRDPDSAWDAHRVAAAIAPFVEEWGAVRFDHAARVTSNTTIQSAGDHVWDVTQTLVDPDDTREWRIVGRVDLSDDTDPDGPLVELVDVSDR